MIADRFDFRSMKPKRKSRMRKAVTQVLNQLQIVSRFLAEYPHSVSHNDFI
jgi:ABC-type oligopeptide transport system ATPase subunit